MSEGSAQAGRRHRVVVVGGGFGGLPATRLLARSPVDVTLIDRRNHHLFQPLLYQVATGILSPGQIAPCCGTSCGGTTTCAWRWPRSTGFDLDGGSSARRRSRARCASIRTTASSSPPGRGSPTSVTTSTR